FLFLQNVRYTLIPALVVPVAMLGAFVVMLALASVMQRVSDIIAVQGKAGPVVVKNALAVPALPYRAQAAQAQCVAGDRNTFVFTAR
uniref:efflux RND transporter permease subunit n=1 Tax=Bordetella pertussis TaxID=520 RepID=UPI00366FE96E